MNKPTRQKNVLDLVMSTEEEIVMNVKIGEHQTVYISIETEKESTALEKYNFNLKRANFNAMHDKPVIIEQLIEGIDAAQTTRSSRTESTTPTVDTPTGNVSPSTANHESKMMSSRPSQEDTEHI